MKPALNQKVNHDNIPQHTISSGEGMVGLKDIHTLTSTGKYRLRVDLSDFYNCDVAVYDNFQVMQYHSYWVFHPLPSPPHPCLENMKHGDDGDGVSEVDSDGMKL